MNHIEIVGFGYDLPEQEVCFNGQKRRRTLEKGAQLRMGTNAARRALKASGMEPEDIDCIIAACAVIIQPIPCNAALFHEALGAPDKTAALDITTTCSSFIAATDILSCLFETGRYRTALVISADQASIGLPENDQPVYEMFGDGAAAFVFRKSEDRGVLCASQITCSACAHLTEIPAGGNAEPPYDYTEEKKPRYQFNMDGLAVTRSTHRLLMPTFEAFLSKAGITRDDIDMVVPHQVGTVLPAMMRSIGIQKGKYIDIVKDYGNMVSVSVPFALCLGIEHGEIKRGSRVMLFGTAAGLTINILYFIY